MRMSGTLYGGVVAGWILLSAPGSVCGQQVLPPYRHVEPETVPSENLLRTTHSHCVNNRAGGFDCEAVDLLGFLPLAEVGGENARANDIWGWTHAPTGREFVLLGLSSGTSFIEITDPLAPRYLGRLPTHSVPSSWRDIKTSGDFAFIVSEAEGHGMQVFDLRKLLPLAEDPRDFVADRHYAGSGLSNAHNIAINEETRTGYVVGSNTCRGGLHMVDLSNPLEPEFAGCFSSDGYVHDAQCVVYGGADVRYVGREVCFSFNEDTVTIVDVTDKRMPSQLARVSYPGVSYTHQGWLSEDHLYLLANDEGDELDFNHNTKTYIWDVSSLTTPGLIAAHVHHNSAIDHNLYIVDDVAYQANYRAGLRVFSLRDVANGRLVSLGWFDVFRTDDAPRFNGAWSVYPFFASGTIAVSGIEQGLFLLDPRFDGFLE